MTPINSAPVDPASPSARHCSLIVFLLYAYGLLIISVSLYPFAGWRVPADPIWSYLTGAWPRYLLAWEIPLNVAGYVPFGMLAAWSRRSDQTPVEVVAWGTALGLALSFCLETTQVFMPTRIASNLDLGSNTAGALIGALAGTLLATKGGMHARFLAWRQRNLLGGRQADFALTLIAIWMFVQISPELGFPGTADVRALVGHEPSGGYRASTYLLIEALLTAANLLCVLILLRLVTPRRQWFFLAAGLVLVAGGVLKTLGARILTLEPQSWHWLTPGVVCGVVLGTLLFVFWERYVHRSLHWFALMAVVGIVTCSYLLPANPYLEIMVHPVAVGHPSSINGAAWGAAQVWPWLALLCIFRLSLAFPVFMREADLA